MAKKRRKRVNGSRARARARRQFLEALGRTGNVTEACREAGVGRTIVYAWREAEIDFRSAWLAAEETATDALVTEARRRGVEGVDEPVFQGGKLVGTVRRYSDRMLEILLKGHRHAYRENQRLEVTGPAGGPVVATLVDVVNAAAKDEETEGPAGTVGGPAIPLSKPPNGKA